MSYTFQDQQTKLSQLLGDSNTSTEDAWPLAVRKKAINRGELQFANDSELLRGYDSSTVSSLQIDVPSDWLKTFVLFIINGNKYQKITSDREISVKDLERYGDYGGDIPFYYVWQFSNTRRIKLLGSSGINGRTYQLFYIVKPTTELDDDSDESLFPEEFREASVYHAASELIRQIGKIDMAAEFKTQYLEYVGRAQKRAVEMYMDYDLPRPDFNIADTTIQDIQGGGLPV